MQKGGCIVFSILSSFLLCFPVFAFQYDAGIAAKDVFFDKDEIIIGKPLRIYAVVKNYGDQDIEAYVTFYQGPALIGQSQPISLRASGLAEEVFVDWIVPEGNFNILAKIQGQNPSDENPGNDETITNIFIPDIDTDNDGIGNRRDDDDDNDGILDIQEKTQGLDPLKADTDGDGVNDAQDIYPLDSTKSKNEPPPVPKITAQTITPKTTSPTPLIPQEVTVVSPEIPVVLEEAVVPIQEVPVQERVTEEGIDIKTIQFSWKLFGFEVKAKSQAQYEWHFPDGQVIKDVKAIKEFPGSGTYTVVLQETRGGVTQQVTTQVQVAYLHPANVMMWIWIGFSGLVGVLLTFGCWFVIRKGKH